MIGQRIAQYEILEQVGAGGMGVVYRARDVELHRDVAIKILPPQLAQDAAAKERFKQEARTASALDHPNICTIYQAGETEDGQIFLAMAFYEGETLRQRIARGPMTTGEAIEITAQLAHGLARAHEAGIVHRDIKPANVMVTERGEAKILDFGLAKLAEGARLTREGTTVGTAAYMSPEQVRGGEIDGGTDIWSLGVVVFEMLTGELPFRGPSDAAAIRAILEDEPPDVATLRADLPEPLAALVRECLVKDPTRRLATAIGVLEALRPLRGETPTEAYLTPEEPTRAIAPPAPAPRRRLAWALGATLALALALVALWPDAEPESPTAGGVSDTSVATAGAAVVTILPFTFRGHPEFGYLGEGIVDLLSTKLDGAGDLRTSDPAAVLGRVEREGSTSSDPESARRIAASFGATYWVSGEILEAGGKLHISAALHTAASSRPVSTVSAEGSAEELFGLVDEIASTLLAEQLQGPGVRIFSTAAMTTDSLPALRSYLRAESEMRRGEFTSALGSYQETVELDPEFALAWYRLSVAAEWATRNDLVADAVARALEFEDRLSEHDRSLLEARLANRRGDPVRSEQIYRSILGRYPDDVEAWTQMSELLSHYGYMTGRSMTTSRNALERVIHYEPDHVGAWWHLARVAAVEGKAQEVDDIVERIIDLNPEGERALEVEILRAVVLGDDAELDRLLLELERVEDHVVLLTSWNLAMSQIDPAAAIRVTEVLTRPTRTDQSRALGHEYLAWLELCRGRIDAAFDHLAASGELWPVRRLEAEPLIWRLPWVPTDRERLVALRAELRTWDPAEAQLSIHPSNFFAQHDNLHPLLRQYLIVALDTELDPEADPDAVPDFGAGLPATLESGIPKRLATYLSATERAVRLARRGENERALATLDAAEFGWAYQDAYASPYYSAAFARWLRAELLRQAGRLDEALTWYSTFGEIGVADEAFYVPAALRRGEILEARGSTDQALTAYRQVEALWRGADPELSSWVDRARDRIAALEPPGA